MSRRMRPLLVTMTLAACSPGNASDTHAMPAQAPNSSAARHRAVVLTFDDLTAVSVDASTTAHRAITDALVGGLAAEHIPAIGFVNENKLVRNGRIDSAEVSLLERWIDAGLELGNHTYSHIDLHNVTVEAYKADILRGDSVTRSLLARAGRQPAWFRHPFLHTGRDTVTRQRITDLLATRGYHVAPVTIDNSDYIFARAYDLATERRDSVEAGRIAGMYIMYMDTVFGFYERQSQAILGYELPQILLLHANRLNADHLGRLTAMMRKRGYDFVSIETAMQDSAYRRPDSYTGPAGITWLHRWATTAGMPGETFRGEPEVPDAIARAAR